MANPENLIPNEQRTPSERRENARKAGIASGKKRRERKLMREILEDMLKKTYTNSQGQQVDGATLICLKQFQSAVDGDLKAFTEIRNTGTSQLAMV